MRELRAALEDAAEGICRIDLDGRVLSVNRAFTRLVGTPAEQSIGRSWEALIAAEDRAALGGDLRAVGEKVEREVQGVRADGATFEMQLSIVPVLEPNATRPILKGHYFFIRDLSDRKRMENQLIFAGRMAAVGTLAAGRGARDQQPARLHRGEHRLRPASDHHRRVAALPAARAGGGPAHVLDETGRGADRGAPGRRAGPQHRARSAGVRPRRRGSERSGRRCAGCSIRRSTSPGTRSATARGW